MSEPELHVYQNVAIVSLPTDFPRFKKSGQPNNIPTTDISADRATHGLQMSCQRSNTIN